MTGFILIVDDDRGWAQLMSSILASAGYSVKHVEDANDAYAFMKEKPVDLVLLDLEMPGISGMEFLSLIKREPKTASVPVIMITVKADVPNKVRGLKTGADDYLPKSCSDKELLARVEALLRRSSYSMQAESVLDVEGIAINLDRQEASVKGKKIDLTKGELLLLAAMMRRRGMVFSYQSLAEAGNLPDATSGAIYVHIRNIRKKLGSLGKLIETVYGSGYKFASRI